jgi:hypothetical protein
MTRYEYRRQLLPYGLWLCADKREVLFNRRYKPIWQRVDDIVWPADHTERVQWEQQLYFYNDLDVRQHTKLCRRLEAVLVAFKSGEPVLHVATLVWTRGPMGIRVEVQ